jgi:hypothetical protein
VLGVTGRKRPLLHLLPIVLMLVLVLVLVFPENEKRPIARKTIKTRNFLIVLVVVVVLGPLAVKNRGRRTTTRGEAGQRKGGSLRFGRSLTGASPYPPDLEGEKSAITS